MCTFRFSRNKKDRKVKFFHAFTFTLTLILLISTTGILKGQQYISVKDNCSMKDDKPVLGWSSWSYIRRKPTASKIMTQALSLHHSGLQKIGYEYINLDDFWYLGAKGKGPSVDKYGRWVTDPSKFPPRDHTNGIKVVANYVHSLGLKFGIYITPGISKQAVRKNTIIKGTTYTADQIADTSKKELNYNFQGMVGINFSKPGAQAYINSWADMFATWGIDFIKLDGMQNSNVAEIKAWHNAIQQAGRPMILDITQGSFTSDIALTLIKYADQWEFAPDIECYSCEKKGNSYPLTSWQKVKSRFDYVAKWQPYAGPTGHNDYDAIEIGNAENNGLTKNERKTQLSLWALGASPLILGVDLTHLDQNDLRLLRNKAILAIDQDGIPAKRVVDTKAKQVFSKMETNGSAIVGLFNISSKKEKIAITPTLVGLTENQQGYSLKNLWTRKFIKTKHTISATIPSHGVVLYRVKNL